MPKGEALFWQGAPCFTTLARRVMRLLLIAAYFAVLLAWREALVLSGATAGLISLSASEWWR